MPIVNDLRYSSYFRSDISLFLYTIYIVASELKDPIWHSLEWQIGSFSSEATIYMLKLIDKPQVRVGTWMIEIIFMKSECISTYHYNKR